MNILLISYWQATEETAKGMTIALLRSAVLPPVFILVIPLAAGIDFFWFGHSITETVTAAAAIIMLLYSNASSQLNDGKAQRGDGREGSSS